MRHLYYWLRKISLIFFSCFYYYFKHHPLAKLLLVCTTHGSLKMNVSINFEREFKFYIFYFITFIFQLFCFYDYVAVKSSCLAVKSFCQVSLGTIQGNHNSKISSTCKHNIKALRQISKEYLRISDVRFSSTSSLKTKNAWAVIWSGKHLPIKQWCCLGQ